MSIYSSGSPPPPQNVSYKLIPHVCNATHYPVVYMWLHPLQNSSITSAITQYILTIEHSKENKLTLTQGPDVSNVTLWQEYNKSYNISVQSKSCNFTESIAASIEIFKINYMACKYFNEFKIESTT